MEDQSINEDELVDSDVESVLNADGVTLVDLETYKDQFQVSLDTVRQSLGNKSWAVRIAYNERFGGVLIQQQPGEGNRKHYHTDADENWVIMDGEWEWWIEGQGWRRVFKNDIVVVPRGVAHQIRCVGSSPGVRYAVTAPDVGHVYPND